MSFPGDVLAGPLIEAIFGPPKPRREPIKAPDDRGYGGPTMGFMGWPNLSPKSYPRPVKSHISEEEKCPTWLALTLGGISWGVFLSILFGVWT